jgi:2-polyprenyl-3-methyl-5-hydroxy-6-metoxy-1,4-benzoquinol methylase
MTRTRPASHFERLYQSNPDPWNFQASPYERSKYEQTHTALGDRRFTSGLEVGCSIGILSHMLATNCDRFLGVDFVESALQSARTRCADLPHASFERRQVPDSWPQDRFDLIVFSEVLYFLTQADIDRCARHVEASLLPNPTIILVNWLGKTDDPTTGDDAANRFIATTGKTLAVTHQERNEHYRLDLLTSA